ncbi:hypothetical protein FCM35_KLT18163 [Carex littledalei]|uniref:Uncharacterized protein n=1 Tax=Carex littledalei TaxID=544730 RepID=A0A833RE96_9POAL|nr:hypothetical protein FCM35_KLT18163 [Carex littledalei]
MRPLVTCHPSLHHNATPRTAHWRAGHETLWSVSSSSGMRPPEAYGPNMQPGATRPPEEPSGPSAQWLTGRPVSYQPARTQSLGLLLTLTNAHA